MARISKAREVRRQEMIQTACELFQQNGYEQTTVHDIVRTQGVAQGLFYYYFKSKEDVLFAVLEQMGEQLLQHIAQIIAAQETPPIERIREAFSVITNFLMHCYDALRLPAISTQLHALFEQQTRRLLMPYLTQLLTDGRRSGDFHVAYPEYTARFILSGFIGVCLGAEMPAAEEIITLLQNFVERILAMPEGALIPAVKE
ncbi:MAG: TetR/AcrR family transcriptional regulator [Clostridia bacterium]|nr:TetR/AcrR family transcriptional regulator [Clostridia bacterium]